MLSFYLFLFVKIVFFCGNTLSQPNPPRGLAYDSIYSTSFTLSWNQLEDTTYRMVIVNEGETIINCDAKTTVNSPHTVHQLNSLSSYFIGLCAVNSAGTSNPSTLSVFTGPPPPVNLLTVNTAVSSFTVQWNDECTGDEAQCNYYLISYDIIGENAPLTRIVEAPATQFTITGLLSNNVYDVIISIVGIESNTYSDETQVTETTLPRQPNQPIFLSSRKTSIKLQWNDLTGTAQETYTVIQDGVEVMSGINTNMATVDGLTSNTKYQFQIKATNDGGNSVISDAQTMTTDVLQSTNQKTSVIVSQPTTEVEIETQDVPTPFNVMLMTNEDDRYNQTTSLLVKWDMNEGKRDYFFSINLYSETQNLKCSSYLIDEDFNTIKTLEYIAGPPDCTLTPSTLYNATVQIESGVDSPTLGKESLPSNNQATVPDKVDLSEVYEIIDKEKGASGIIFVSWSKLSGGDEIDSFHLNCPPETCELVSQYVPGKNFYQQKTKELTHGCQVNIAVSAENSAGTTSTLPRVIDLEPHPVINLSVNLNEEDPTKYLELLWDTIGVGDNVLVIWSSDGENNSEFVSFSDTFLRVEGKPGSNYSFVLTVNSNSLSSQPEMIMITTKPSAPMFNVTPTSMTSMKVEWQSVEGSIDYYTIELENEDIFAAVVLNKTETNYEYQDLLPYSEYKVYVYSVVINQDGNEVKSPSQPQNILLYYEEFCKENVLPYPGGGNGTFPRTKAGYSNTTVETCSSESPIEGTPYGKRSCTINAEWNAPVWISSCKTTLENLTEVNITNNEERKEVASDLTVLTSNSSSLSSESIEQSASVLESIVDTEELDQNTTTLVIESLGNLLAAPEEELQGSEVQDSLLTTLDEVTTKVVLSEGEEYQSTTSTLAIAVAQIDIASGFSGIGFQENKNPSSESLGFSEGQFQTFNSVLKDQNSTSIYIPESVVSNSEDGRVSFYAFADNKIFQVSKENSANAEDDVIRYDATIQSQIVLSASIQGPDQNLTENVTITFEYNQFVCPKNDNNDSCGEYLCGFWDEEQSVWSKSGCNTRVLENVIECQCNHLTNFANLFASSEYFESNPLDILSYVCCSISLLGSLLTIICLISVRISKSKAISNTTTYIMINLALALTLLNGFLLISNLNEVIENDHACTAIAVLLHFSLFATLLWTTVEASSVCLAIVAPIYYRTNVTGRKAFLYPGIVGWGIPSIFVGLTAGITKLSSYGIANNSTQICWITVEKVTYLVIIPASIIIGINTILYFVTIVTYFRRKQVGSQKFYFTFILLLSVRTTLSIMKRVKISTGKSIIFSLSLFVIFGISWIFGFLLFGSDEFSEVFAYIFTIATGLQGLFIFLLFVVRNKKVAQDVCSMVCCGQSDFSLSKTFSYTFTKKSGKQSQPNSSGSIPQTFTMNSNTSGVIE